MWEGVGSCNSCSWRTNEAKKAPAGVLSPAAWPGCTCCLPARGAEPCATVFIPAQGPDQAPGLINLGGAINNPLHGATHCCLTPAWARGANPLPGSKAAAWHSESRYTFTRRAAGQSLHPTLTHTFLPIPPLRCPAATLQAGSGWHRGEMSWLYHCPDRHQLWGEHVDCRTQGSASGAGLHLMPCVQCPPPSLA